MKDEHEFNLEKALAIIVLILTIVLINGEHNPGTFFGDGDYDITITGQYDENWIEIAKLPRARKYEVIFTKKLIPIPLTTSLEKKEKP